MPLNTRVRVGLWTFVSVSVVWFLFQVVATKIGLVVDRWNGMLMRPGASWAELASQLPILLIRGLFIGLIFGIIMAWPSKRNEPKT